MTTKEALQLVMKNKHLPALNYCIAYARHALILTEGLKLGPDFYLHEFKVQLLYVLNNMTNWRQCKASKTTAAEIKECRSVLKKASA